MRPLLLLLPALLLFTSCGNLQNLAAKSRAKRQQKAMDKLASASSEEAESRLGAKALGDIAYVDDAEQFVLIRTLTGVTIPVHSGLETRQDGKRTALLQATAERKNGFIAADLLEGAPQSGEAVFSSTAKPKRTPLRPTAPPEAGLLPPPALSGAAPARTLNGMPTLPEGTNAAPSDLGFDPANLPPLQDAIITPEDLKR